MDDYDQLCECGTRKGDHAMAPPHRGTRTFCDAFTTPVPVQELIDQLTLGVLRTGEVLQSGSTGAWEGHIKGMQEAIKKLNDRAITQLMETREKP